MGWTTPSQDRAAQFLQGVVREARSRGRPKLPSVKRLAADAGISYVTMWKALRKLRDQAVVEMRPGKGSWLTSSGGKIRLAPPLSGDQPAALQQKWRQLANAVQQDVLSGAYPPGTLLPTAKELMSRYGICHPTLRKALSALVDKGCIRRHGRSYRTPLLSSAHARARVVLMARGDERARGDVLHLRPRVDGHLRALEQECSRAGLGLETIPCLFTSGERMNLADKACAGLKGSPEEEVLGYVLFATSIPVPEIVEVAERLSGLGERVAVLDEDGYLVLPGRLASNDLIGHFCMAVSSGCGYDVGKYLLGLGHRRVAYFTPLGGVEEDQRLRGLSDAFTSAGFPEAISRFVVKETHTQPRESSPEIARMVDALLARALPRRGRHRALYARTAGSLELLISVTMSTEATSDRIVPLLDDALGVSDITAWVGYNDHVALRALDYLRYRKRAVPRDIAVIGFDDSPEALSQKLTSYNFNSAAVMHAMLAHILDPRPPHARTRGGGPREIPGFITERATTMRR
jgi:DNA-binding transcriptional regulator YhcF (GntR family)